MLVKYFIRSRMFSFSTLSLFAHHQPEIGSRPARTQDIVMIINIYFMRRSARLEAFVFTPPSFELGNRLNGLCYLFFLVLNKLCFHE